MKAIDLASSQDARPGAGRAKLRVGEAPSEPGLPASNSPATSPPQTIHSSRSRSARPWALRQKCETRKSNRLFGPPCHDQINGPRICGATLLTEANGKPRLRLSFALRRGGIKSKLRFICPGRDSFRKLRTEQGPFYGFIGARQPENQLA